MFSISHKNKCLFWHVHKNAGSYTEFVLREYYDFDDFDFNSITNNIYLNKNNVNNENNVNNMKNEKKVIYAIVINKLKNLD